MTMIEFHHHPGDWFEDAVVIVIRCPACLKIFNGHHSRHHCRACAGVDQHQQARHIQLSIRGIPMSSPAPIAFAVGAAFQLLATVSDAKGDVLAGPLPLVYATSDASVATVDPATGAGTFIAAGSVTFSASVTNPDGTVAQSNALAAVDAVDAASIVLSFAPPAAPAPAPAPAPASA